MQSVSVSQSVFQLKCSPVQVFLTQSVPSVSIHKSMWLSLKVFLIDNVSHSKSPQKQC